MSRHTFRNEATNSVVAVGWDPQLHSYFAIVLTKTSRHSDPSGSAPSTRKYNTRNLSSMPQPHIQTRSIPTHSKDSSISDRNSPYFYNNAATIASNHTICDQGCSPRDRLNASKADSVLAGESKIDTLCGNCQSPLVPDHDSHVLNLQTHLQIDPKAYKTSGAFSSERDWLIKLNATLKIPYSDVPMDYTART